MILEQDQGRFCDVGMGKRIPGHMLIVAAIVILIGPVVDDERVEFILLHHLAEPIEAPLVVERGSEYVHCAIPFSPWRSSRAIVGRCEPPTMAFLQGRRTGSGSGWG